MRSTPSAPEKAPTGTYRPWLAVGLLWIAGASNYLTRFTIVTMHGSIVAAIPMSDKQFGLLTSGFLVIYAALNPVGGFLADRFSRTRVIVTCVVAWSVVTCLTAYARSFPELLLLRIVMGAAQACFIPAASALVADYHTGATRSRAIGLLMSGLVFGSAVGGLGGWIAQSQGWTYAFKLLGLPGVLFGVLLTFTLRDAPNEPAGPFQAECVPGWGETLAAVFLSWPVVAIILCFVLQNAVSWLVIGWMPTYMHEHFNLGQGAAGLSATGFLYGPQLLGLFAGGAWADRWSRSNPRAKIYVPVIGICAAAPCFWLAGHSGLLPSTVLCLALWGFATGLMGANVMPILCMVIDPRLRATAYGVSNGFGAIAGGLSVLGGGALRDLKIDLRGSLGIAGLLAAACALLFLSIREKPSYGPPEPAAAKA